ncbi:MAG: hypothetical protein ACI304_04925 [Lepagella sp.]
MKTFLKLAAIALVSLISLPILSSCGGASGGSGLFGGLPDKFADMQKEQDALREEAKKIENEQDKAKLIEKSEKMKEEWTVKIENEAKALDGKEISFADSDIKVSKPVSLTYTDFFSKLDLTPAFKVNGEAAAAVDITPESKYALDRFSVYVVGYDDAGQETFQSKVGSIKAEVNGDKAVVKAGTPVEFDTLQFSDKKVEEYQKTKSLKLEVRE